PISCRPKPCPPPSLQRTCPHCTSTSTGVLGESRLREHGPASKTSRAETGAKKGTAWITIARGRNSRCPFPGRTLSRGGSLGSKWVQERPNHEPSCKPRGCSRWLAKGEPGGVMLLTDGIAKVLTN